MNSKKLAAAGLAVLVVTCGGDADNGGTAPPVDMRNPGFVTLTLSTPNSNDGALLLTLSGGVVDSLTASVGDLFFAPIGSTSVRIMVAGTITDGAIGRFWVPDRRNISQYLALVEQAAVRGTYQQQDITGYSLSITP